LIASIYEHKRRLKPLRNATRASHIEIGIPEAVPKKNWRKKKDHGKANARSLTAAEADNKDRKERERLATIAGKARAMSEEVTEEEGDGIYT
jgi:hypothetical protein